MIPPAAPEVPGLDVAAGYRPAGAGDEVGGDFYDIFPVAAGDWVVILGDVSGKSLLHLQCHFGMDSLSLAHAGATVVAAMILPKKAEHGGRVGTPGPSSKRAVRAEGQHPTGG